jgi:hypothetical protein
VKDQIQTDLDKFLNNTTNSELSPTSTDNPLIAQPPAAGQNAPNPNAQKAATPNVASPEAANPDAPKVSARGS